MKTFDDVITKTFDDVITDMTAAELYKGTTVDEATQQVLYDWFFDYTICTFDDEDKFAKYFRRNLNKLYPMYMAQLRINTVKGNFDPFVTRYMESKQEHIGNSTKDSSNKSDSTNKSHSENTSDLKSENDEIPNIVNDFQERVERNPELNTTVSDNGSSNTNSTVRDNNSSNSSNNSGETTNGKSNAFGISYPEANLGSIPTDINVSPSICFANSQSYSLSGNNTNGSSSNQQSGNSTNTSDQNSSHNGYTSTKEQGTEVSYNTHTETQTGNTTTINKSNGSNSSDYNSSSDTESKGREDNSDRSNDGSIEKGRDQSPAELLQKAINAITGSNEVDWLINRMSVCFNLYETM